MLFMDRGWQAFVFYFSVNLSSCNALDVQQRQDNPMDSAGWLQAHGSTCN